MLSQPVMIPGDLLVQGAINAQAISLPDNSVYDRHILAGANIAATKLQQSPRVTYSQDLGQTAQAAEEVLHFVYGSVGTLVRFCAGMVTPCSGDATVTVDLRKNGTSVLQSPITLDSSQSGYETVNAIFSTTSVAAGDVLSIHISVNAGTGSLGSGLFGYLTLHEAAQ